MAQSLNALLFSNSGIMDEEDDAADGQSIIAEQQSLGSVSTLDLPSPALSSGGAEKKSYKKAGREGSWVWRWAEKRSDAAGIVRVYCLVPSCSQKKGWAWIGSSTSNIRNHLMGDHKLNEHVQKDGAYTNRTESIQIAIANQGKRSSAHFSMDALERHVCKILVRHRLPYTFVQSPLLKELLHLAPMDDLKLPSKYTITRKVCQLRWTEHNVLNQIQQPNSLFINNHGGMAIFQCRRRKCTGSTRILFVTTLQQCPWWRSPWMVGRAPFNRHFLPSLVTGSTTTGNSRMSLWALNT
ncbi:hypothetical protein EDD21DRAFT_139469 [Dissophora ornata]|nr:hypothetical protein EDD21DRAFT_139469 [Dissophora ornata]